MRPEHGSSSVRREKGGVGVKVAMLTRVHEHAQLLTHPSSAPFERVFLPTSPFDYPLACLDVPLAQTVQRALDYSVACLVHPTKHFSLGLPVGVLGDPLREVEGSVRDGNFVLATNVLLLHWLGFQ